MPPRSPDAPFKMSFIPLPPIVLATATLYETLLKIRDSQRQPPGRLITLHRRKLHVLYNHPPHLSHTPCVILESGANSWSPVWRDVFTHLSTFTRVFSYDRPGMGYSHATSIPRTPRAIAHDLQQALQICNATGPYVLVAHSLGALYINALLQMLRPKQVCGVVYVDAASPETVRMLQDIVPTTPFPRFLAVILSAFGVLRYAAPAVLTAYAKAFRRFRKEAVATWARGQWLSTYTEEWSEAVRYECEFPEGWLEDLPINVLVPDIYRRTGGKGFIEELQWKVAQYSTNSKVQLVKECGHFVQMERPDVVVGAVREVLERGGVKVVARESCGEWEG